MVYNVYLHKYVIDILSQFGEIDTVINHIVDAGMAGAFSMQDLPKAPDRTPGEMTQLQVDIHNVEYNELLGSRGGRSMTYSLRRIIYHFVDNEIYSELGWEPVASAAEMSSFTRRLANLITDAMRLHRSCPFTLRPYCNKVLTALKEFNDASQQHIK